MDLPFDPGGLVWVVQWNSLQHPIASAFLAVLYSDYMLTSQTEMLYCNGKSYNPEDLRKFAISQVCNLLPPMCNCFAHFSGAGASEFLKLTVFIILGELYVPL